MATKKSGGAKTTPMMRQYLSMRESLPDDVLLFFRLGDFYELFYEDAQVAAGILNVALTKRNGYPMCGVPHHAAEGYIGKLVKAGKRVAIAEQTSEPQPGKIVQREISQVISAGTVSDLNLLEAKQANYLAGVYQMKKTLGLAYVDLSTGDFRVTEFSSRAALEDELGRVAPSELLVSDEQESSFRSLPNAVPYDGYAFLYDQAFHSLKEHFQVHSLDGFGCGEMGAAIGAAGALLHYLQHQLRRKVAHILRLQPYASDAFVLIDQASQANLDLVTSRAGKQHTLLHALDKTCTPMGARMLRDWLLHPLRDLRTLQVRQDVIEAMLQQPFILSQIQESLKGIRDIERTLGRLSQGSGNARDLRSLAKALQAMPDLHAHVQALPATALAGEWLERLHDFPELVARLDAAIVEEPPATIKEGGIFRDGYNADLDEIRAASREGKQWVADLQAGEIERTGIRSLKVRYNAVFGYFIEVTKANLAQVPEDLSSQANDRQRRALHHSRTQGDGEQDSGGRRTHHAPSSTRSFNASAMSVLTELRNLQDSSSDALAADRCHCRSWQRNRTPLQLHVDRSSTSRKNLYHQRRTPPGARSDASPTRKLFPMDTTLRSRHQSSTYLLPDRTWPANRPTSGR